MSLKLPHRKSREAVDFSDVLAHRTLFENVLYTGLINESCKQYQQVQADRYGGFGGDCRKWYGVLPSVYLRNEIDAEDDENREMMIRYIRLPMWTNQGRVPLHTIFFVSLRRYSQRDMKAIRKICLGLLYNTIMEKGEQTFSEKNPITILVTGEQKGLIYPNISKDFKIFCFSARRDVLEVKSRVFKLLMSFLDVRSTRLKSKTDSRTFENRWTLVEGRVRLYGILLMDYKRIRGLYHRLWRMASETWREIAKQRQTGYLLKRTCKEKTTVSNIRSTICIENTTTAEMVHETIQKREKYWSMRLKRPVHNTF